MATIIAVRGTGNSGKTTSIRQALTLIEATYPSANRVQIIRDGVEIIIVIKIDGIIIILASSGDVDYILQKLFDAISHIDWDILVCATKSYGKTVAFIEKKEDSTHQLRWIEKNRATEAAQYENANATTAQEIITLIEQAYPALTRARRRA